MTLQAARIVSACVLMLPMGSGVAATLNKCIDTEGKVTYSNLPCRTARTLKLEIDPPPEPDPPRSAPARTSSPEPEQKREATRSGQAEKPTKPAASTSASKCNSLSDKLGRVIDTMDAAHRKGYTQQQMDDWNQQVRALERQKQQAGCF
ncbi:MAG: hypothetical protein B7Y26_10330 [Hydrogenophilales bacterium 16-64-46]|nr:MAG: hypothetical protein B7Z32_05610 [Hydrogenophilales bacterium 12-64-13]OYZ05012.1 MAG: hypothetical protein B7Y26_10330 [Hydrogenophilales bacterium 16-64-46]OZA36763.1 MAG: hypothetical protein B7X87_13410 [Hydrogenophilales bacterium 17-64-34]